MARANTQRHLFFEAIMNPLVKKEIRLLLPSWLAVLSLAIFLPWFSWKNPYDFFAWMPLFIFFGVILLAVDSFGREFSLGTFSSLISQPMERRQIWWTKITILFFAAALIYAGHFISADILFHRTLNNTAWSVSSDMFSDDFRDAMFCGGAAVFIALVGGLWTTLLLRQISAAFWITFLVPLGLLMLITFFMPIKLAGNDHIFVPFLYSLAGIYCVAGFWLAHRLFHQAQDAAWTGGVISFSKWRYYDASSKTSVSVRQKRPFSALLKKEFQLHSISLFCAGALLVLHIGVFFLRAFYVDPHKNSVADTISEFFWVLWLIMPLTIGCMAVAEERKLGVMEGQFCQPVARRFQFAIKFIPVMIFGVLLGGVMPLLLEAIAAWVGAPNDYFKPESHAGNEIFSGMVWFQICVIASAAGLTLVGFFASTLAKNFMQALSIAIVGTVACFFFEVFLTRGNSIYNGEFIRVGTSVWGGFLPMLIGLLTIVLFIPWLAYRNFSHFVERGRFLRRNVFCILGAVLFVFTSSAVIYNRVWEIVELVEPSHGPAKLYLSNPPKLQSDAMGGLLVRLPDGRFWCDCLPDSRWDYYYWGDQPNSWEQFRRTLIPPFPKSGGPGQFLSGSNWISMTIPRHVNLWIGHDQTQGYLDTFGIQADGSLWISSEAKPTVWTGAKMSRFDDETNWQQVISQFGTSFLLLKSDGTLWQWRGGTNFWNGRQTNWPSVRAFKPQQIGADSHWQDTFLNSFARKKDGSVYRVESEYKTNGVAFLRLTNLDQVNPETYSQYYNRSAYVGKDGALWIGNWHVGEYGSSDQTFGYLRVGMETNWVTTAVDQNRMIVLKSDGSLWQWQLDTKSPADAVKIPPARFGLHNDWVDLTSTLGGVVSLAADGSLWFWPGTDYDGTMLKPPKQPELLGNVFTKSD
jgi:ABC-type transport system involved in multi-copper enzyme maturation permease subunit